MKCPNKNTQDWKNLVSKLGSEELAYAAYLKNNFEIPIIKVKEGVDFVFQQNPELSKIGTQQQYSQYLATIFPDSKVKDVVYHHSSQKIENFNKSFLGKETGSPDTQLGFFFAENKKDIPNMVSEKNEQLKKLGSSKVLDFSIQNNVLINIKNPEYHYGFIEEAVSNLLGREANILAKTARDDYKEARLKLENSGKDSLVYGLSTDYDDGDHNVNHGYVILEPENIHVLGSKNDLNKFKEFVNNKESYSIKGGLFDDDGNFLEPSDEYDPSSIPDDMLPEFGEVSSEDFNEYIFTEDEDSNNEASPIQSKVHEFILKLKKRLETIQDKIKDTQDPIIKQELVSRDKTISEQIDTLLNKKFAFDVIDIANENLKYVKSTLAKPNITLGEIAELSNTLDLFQGFS